MENICLQKGILESRLKFDIHGLIVDDFGNVEENESIETNIVVIFISRGSILFLFNFLDRKKRNNVDFRKEKQFNS